jgi:ADP-dependent NAD(P)H-hydrate dehydratase / NAD(P)H-hydrate epimerase
MIKLAACAEASRLDAATASGAAIPPLLLMEDASLRLWDAIEPIARACGAGDTRLLLALCGPGNNGGDVLALIRHARFSGLGRVAAILATKPGELASLHAASLKALGVGLFDWKEDRAACEKLLAEASLIVDGLSGTGLSGPLREPLSSLLEAANAATRTSAAAIASIDLPSGLSDSYEQAWPLVAASWTLSVEPRKACLYYPAVRASCGEIVPIRGVFPADSSIAPSAFLLEAGDLSSLAPLPPDSAYKGSRGRVAVFAGSVGASGAAVLASRSCLAAGAGIAALYASRELYPVAAPMLDAVMVKMEPEDFRGFDAGRYDALLIGPGWGREEKRRGELAALLETGLPAVLDADAIHLYRSLLDSGFRPSAPTILTPHPGEFAAIAGIDSDRALAAPPAHIASAARALNAVIVLKSHVTWIASPEGETAVWDGRECGLGTAGSGDVLAGLAAGLLARSAAASRAGDSKPGAGAGYPSAFSAARAAVIAHGLAGRRAREERGWFESSAIIEEAAKLLGQRSPI